jgi:hypothetical protein
VSPLLPVVHLLSPEEILTEARVVLDLLEVRRNTMLNGGMVPARATLLTRASLAAVSEVMLHRLRHEMSDEETDKFIEESIANAAELWDCHADFPDGHDDTEPAPPALQ